RGAAEVLAGPAGEALRGLLGEALSDESRAASFRRRSHGLGRRMMQEIARRAVERGEIEAGAVTPRRLDVGQALLRQHFLFAGPPIPDELIVEIVDEVVVPLLQRG
uniref:TetR-like C-terminal domain-containing protein n=1 Tax=Nonomuraea lactucae TaxID=2249762 RepID=UPI001962465E